MKWEPKRLEDWIDEASFPIDKDGLEGFVFEKLKQELIYNKKLNYNYERRRQQRITHLKKEELKPLESIA